MSPCEWRNKHRKCKWCAYFRKRDMRYLLFPVLEPDGFCTAKDKMVYSKIPRLFCCVFELIDYKNFYKKFLEKMKE